MLHLIQSNKMERLAEQLMAWLQEGSGNTANIFDADTILVQSPGMAQWLKIQIAQNMGIAANLDFPLPSSFIWQLYRQYVPELPEQSAFTKPNMTWKLMSILPGLLEGDEFQSIREYLSDGQPLKLYQLCHKVADVYDQYLVYRPHWILAWEEGENNLSDTDISEHPWQPILWRALRKYSEQLTESVYHRANLHQQLLEGLLEQAAVEAKIEQNNPKPLYVFGISAMPLQQLEVLAALAKGREVVIFWFNPSQHYWGDVVDSKTQAKAKLQEIDSADSGHNSANKSDYLDVGNPLLSSWGKLGRDYQDMLLNIDLQQHDDFVGSKPENALQTIQDEVLNLQFRGASESLSAKELLSNGEQYPKIPLSCDDQSIQVHACHSKVRELEVLHDNLLRYFEKNPQWQPGDVIVMMPDVAAYAPFIEGVFGGVEFGLHIPYAISDRNVGEESPILNSFIELMKLHQSRVTLSDVLAICEVPAVQAKFDLSLQEFELLQHWLGDVGVRWGWDQADKSRWDVPPEQQNTWLFGLTRLLSGYAMSAQHLYQGVAQNGSPLMIAPYGDIEGQQAVALGKFYQFVEVLKEALAFCQEASTIPDKVRGSLELLEKLYLPEEQDQGVLTALRQAIESMSAHQEQFTQIIEQDIFVGELEQNLQDKGVGQRFLAGYVNFCTLMPMRSIPFKAVCLLGMNDGDYPRQVMPLGFDLMRKGPAKRGDRSRRLDDRYLFLEALLSAREVLYLSYQGFSQKDNSPRSPSILLSELLEYCQHCFCLDGQQTLCAAETEKHLLNHLQTQHALQPFAGRYYQEEHALHSYQEHWMMVAKQQGQQVQAQVFLAGSLPDSPEDLSTRQKPENNELDLDDLSTFFINPAKAFFIQRWQCRFANFSNVNQDDEPFAFDPLDKYKLNERLIAGDQQTNWLQRLGAEGKLPLANSGAIYLRQIEKQSALIVDQIETLCGEHEANRLEVKLILKNLKLVGWIDQFYGQNLVMWRAGKVRAKDKLTLYLNWLCLCAKPPKSGLGQAHFIGTDKPFSLGVIDAAEATQHLNAFVDVWRLGQSQAVYFFPETAWQWIKTEDPDKTLQCFTGNNFAVGEGQEPHIQRLCPDLGVHFEGFCKLSEQLMAPLFNYGGGK